MKLTDVNEKTVKKITVTELFSLHRRVHQLYGVAKKRKPNKKLVDSLTQLHNILVKEIERRKYIHKSPLK